VIAPGQAAADDNLFGCRLARSERERAAYFELRRSIFCAEQGLFAGHDRDAWDDVAHPIVCLADTIDPQALVVGVVRIWEEAPGDWWGGRLGVAVHCRTAGVVGRRLVRTAVGVARAWGAHRFRAIVQQANVAFFMRLRWRTLEAIDHLGQPHHLMQADLDRYAPVDELRPEPWLPFAATTGRDAA
jgi:putative N-acetyltransferase (TIGR04045 family)